MATTKKAEAKDDAAKIPATTAPAVDDDVTKVAIVSTAAQPIDEKATRETIEQDRALTEARERNSPAARLAASGLMFIDDPQARKRYVAVPPAEGEVSIHGTPAIVLSKTPLANHAPEPGIMVYPESGEPFAIQEGQRDWLGVTNSAGEPLFAASKVEATKAARASR